MRGRVYQFDDAEQALREWTTAQRAAYALKQRIEKQRWEVEVLAPAQEKLLAALQEGELPVLELPSMREIA